MIKKLIPALCLSVLVSCGGDDPEPKITGCMDKLSVNYNHNATQDNGTCVFPADVLAGNWKVTEQTVLHLDSSGFVTTTTFPKANYHALITAVNKTRISIDSDRSDPVYVYKGELTIDWNHALVQNSLKTFQGSIISEDSFNFYYVYNLTSAWYTVTTVYERDE